ncbi:hypothetical protein SZ25_00395, partial [Candidatus Arcanobacter lacustris]
MVKIMNEYKFSVIIKLMTICLLMFFCNLTLANSNTSEIDAITIVEKEEEDINGSEVSSDSPESYLQWLNNNLGHFFSNIVQNNQQNVQDLRNSVITIIGNANNMQATVVNNINEFQKKTTDSVNKLFVYNNAPKNNTAKTAPPSPTTISAAIQSPAPSFSPPPSPTTISAAIQSP